MRAAPNEAAIALARRFGRFWSVQDVDLTSDLLALDAVYEQCNCSSLQPYSAMTRGRENIREFLFSILKDWDFNAYTLAVLSADSIAVRCHVDFSCQHRRTGLQFTGTKRLTITVANGEITRLASFHDRARVDAFMRLVRWTESNDMNSPTPVFLD